MTKLKINHVYMCKETSELHLCRMYNDTLLVIESCNGFLIDWRDDWFIDLGEL